MRIRVRVLVEVVDEARLGRPIGDRVIASAEAVHEHLVGVHPATEESARFAAEVAGPIALRRAISGALASAELPGPEDRTPRRRVVDSPQA